MLEAGTDHLVYALSACSFTLLVGRAHSAHQMRNHPGETQHMIGVHVSDEDPGDIGDLERRLVQAVEGAIGTVEYCPQRQSPENC